MIRVNWDLHQDQQAIAAESCPVLLSFVGAEEAFEDAIEARHVSPSVIFTRLRNVAAWIEFRQ
jgi:hypothetical protein